MTAAFAEKDVKLAVVVLARVEMRVGRFRDGSAIELALAPRCTGRHDAEELGRQAKGTRP